MAETKSLVFHETSGTLGNILTFTRKKSGKVIMGAKRRLSDTPPTDKQLEIRGKFKKATAYASAVLKDPVKKALYQAKAKGDESAYNVATRDAFNAPEIGDVDTAAYTGQAGQLIRIKATDDFEVAGVQVKITSAAGIVVEYGPAVLDADSLDWLYATTTVNDVPAGSKITITAVDRPANQTVKDVLI
jgi:hypothetical protein